MGLPLVDIQQIGAPTETEHVATGTSVVYGSTVYAENEVIEITGDDGHEIEFVPEYSYLADLGSQWYEDALIMWDEDESDAELSEYLWRLGDDATSTNFLLDKTEADIASTYALKVLLDTGTDDEIRVALQQWGPQRNFYKALPTVFPASKVLELEIRHIESDAGVNGLQYQLRQEIKTPTYWNGSIWTTETWIDVTVSATEASFTDAVTLDSSESTYTLALRNKGADSSESSHVSRVSLHETLTTGEGSRLSANVPMVYVTPYRCRIASIADNASKNLYVSRLGK